MIELIAVSLLSMGVGSLVTIWFITRGSAMSPPRPRLPIPRPKARKDVRWDRL